MNDRTKNWAERRYVDVAAVLGGGPSTGAFPPPESSLATVGDSGVPESRLRTGWGGATGAGNGLLNLDPRPNLVAGREEGLDGGVVPGSYRPAAAENLRTGNSVPRPEGSQSLLPPTCSRGR